MRLSADEREKCFLEGVLYAAQELVLTWGDTVAARHIITSSGTVDEFLKIQKKTGHHTRRMNKFLREECS